MNEHARRPRPPATYQDVLDAPPTMVAELVEGGLHLHPRPAFPHAVAATSLADEIVSPFQKGRGGPPGLADRRRTRASPRPERSRPRPGGLAAGTDAGLLGRRLDGHRPRLGLVDPKDRTLEAFALEDGRWLLLAALKDDEAVRLPPFDAIAFALSALWPE